jgi:hypothetical protein
VDLPVAGSVTFTLDAMVSGTAVDAWSNKATVSVPSGVADPDPSNNSATDTDTVVPVNNSAASAKDVLMADVERRASAFPGAASWFRYKVQAPLFCVEVDNGRADTSVRDTILEVYRATLPADSQRRHRGRARWAVAVKGLHVATASEDNRSG